MRQPTIHLIENNKSHIFFLKQGLTALNPWFVQNVEASIYANSMKVLQYKHYFPDIYRRDPFAKVASTLKSFMKMNTSQLAGMTKRDTYPVQKYVLLNLGLPLFLEKTYHICGTLLLILG